MAKLTEHDKRALGELSRKGWVQSDVERSPVFVNPAPEMNQA